MNLRTRVTAFALISLLSGLLVGCGGDANTEPVAADPNPETTSGSTSEPTTPAESPTESPSDGTGEPGAVAAPIYFVGDTPLGSKLYREFRQVGSDNPMEEALALLVTGDALDPDYGTLLSGLVVTSVSDNDDMIVVDLGADSRTADKSVSPDDGALAVQSLVYTLQGVSQTSDPVQVTVGGVPTPLFGQPTDTGVDAADQLDVLALVSITTPESDAAVSGTFTADGVASSFEATVPWQVRDESGEVVLDGFSTADGWVDKLYPWSSVVDVSSLDPGTYTFAALTDDPSGGEGPGPFEDTKTITVE